MILWLSGVDAPLALRLRIAVDTALALRAA
jgi:hypothetical protein